MPPNEMDPGDRGPSPTTAPPEAPPATAATSSTGTDEDMTRNAGSVGAATFLSRLLGLVREQTFALLFGAGREADAFNVAFRIPNLLRDLFAEGALSNAFNAVFPQVLAKEGPEAAKDLARRIFGTLLLVTTLICVLGIVFARNIVDLMASGFSAHPGKAELTTSLTQIMAPFFPLIAAAAVAMGILNTLKIWFIPALSPAMLNLGMIVVGSGLALAAPSFGYEPIQGMAVGVLAGGFGQLLIQLVPLAREGYMRMPLVDFRHPRVRELIRLWAPATFAQAAADINVFVSTHIASMMAQGSVSWLNFAFRLFHLPVGVFGVSVANVSRPEISLRIASGKLESVREAVGAALRLVLVLTLPATVGLIVLARPVIALVYERGAFEAVDTEATAQALICYAIGLVFLSAVKIFVPTFIALKETSIPVKATFVTVAVNVALNIAFMDSLEFRGLALANSLAAAVQAIFLAVLLRPRLGGLDGRRTLPAAVRIALASTAMGAACHGLLHAWGPTQGTLLRLAQVLALIGAGIVTYITTLKLLGGEEYATFRSITSRILRRLRR